MSKSYTVSNTKDPLQDKQPIGVLEGWIKREMDIENLQEITDISKYVLSTFGSESLFYISTVYYREKYREALEKTS